MNHDESAEPVIVLCDGVVRLHHQMEDAYERLAKTLSERPGDEQALSRAQSRADVLGKRYERLCDRICRTEAATLDGVLAKLQCATRCIRDIVPEGKDPELACDIELRFAFAVERDVRRLIANARRTMSRRRPGVTPGNRKTTSSATANSARAVHSG
jgi:hypothetical protein